MSISTNIDGSVGGGANQLLDLLSLVSNPAVYEAKVKSLQATIAENKKYVEAVAPASEILEIREQVKADKAASTTALAEAKVKADGLVKTAQEKANALVAEATANAKKVTDDADSIANEIKASLAESKKAVLEAKKSKTDSDTLNESLRLQLAELGKQREQAATALQKAEDLKAEIITKHLEFIKSL